MTDSVNDLDLLTALHFTRRDGLEIVVVALVFDRVLRLITENARFFQLELRATSAHLGQSQVTRFFRRLDQGPIENEIADAAERFSRSDIGVIIVADRDMPLGEFVESGSAMEAKLTADLLATISTPYSPLHDGAVIVRGVSIIGAGCFLPRSQSAVADRSLGARHRAALGLSAESDALIIVVSEETTSVSVAQSRILRQQFTSTQVRHMLVGREVRQHTSEFVIVGCAA